MLLETWFQIHVPHLPHDTAATVLAQLMGHHSYTFGTVYVDHAEPADSLLLLEVTGLDPSAQRERLSSLQDQLSKLSAEPLASAARVMMMLPSNYVAPTEYIYSHHPTKYLIQLEVLPDTATHEFLWTIGSCDIQDEPGWCFETLFTTRLDRPSEDDETPPREMTVCVEAFDATADPDRIVKKLEEIFAEDSIAVNADDSGIILRRFSLPPGG